MTLLALYADHHPVIMLFLAWFTFACAVGLKMTLLT